MGWFMRMDSRHGHNGVKPAVAAIILALGLAGCSKPAPVAVVLPPAPVGHAYQVLVAVPPAPPRIARKITPDEQAELQQSFNIIALKSALMVAALSCAQQDKYDAFMNDFQPHILAAQHVIDAYFKRIGGHYGQAREDDFVTLLANNQSVSGIGQGAIFCLNNTAEFQEVLALKTPAALDNFVTDQPPAGAADASPVAVAAAPAPVAKKVKLADDNQQ
jgi:hypothetical protein